MAHEPVLALRSGRLDGADVELVVCLDVDDVVDVEGGAHGPGGEQGGAGGGQGGALLEWKGEINRKGK